jgi:hypothetical protein
MKILFRSASVLLAAIPLNAQVTAALNRFPARSPEIEIRNTSTVNLTAFAVSMDPVAQGVAGARPFLVFVDSAVDPDRMLLPPDEKYSIPVTSGFRGGRIIDLFEPPITIAAIFEDGSTSGDPALLSRLATRRISMLQAVELACEILSKAGSHNIPPGQLIDQFRTLADSLNHWYLPPEQQVGRTLYESIVARLKGLEPQPAGSPFPPTAFVEQELQLLIHRRGILLESTARR